VAAWQISAGEIIAAKYQWQSAAEMAYHRHHRMKRPANLKAAMAQRKRKMAAVMQWRRNLNGIYIGSCHGVNK